MRREEGSVLDCSLSGTVACMENVAVTYWSESPAQADGELTVEEQRQLRRDLQRTKNEIASLNEVIQGRQVR